MEKVTASDLYEQLYLGYSTIMSTAVIPEASIVANYNYGADYKKLKALGSETSVRRIDALILFRDKRWAVEIKVSLSDLKSELAKPEKHALWALHTNSFYFLVAPNLVDYALANVPKQYGIMTSLRPMSREDFQGKTWEWQEKGITILRRAKVNKNPEEIPYHTWRRMGSAYAKTRRELISLRADLLEGKTPAPKPTSRRRRRNYRSK